MRGEGQGEGQVEKLRLAATPANLIRGKVTRYELPHLCGLNFVLHDALEGGVNASLNLDSHGKSWSYLFLGLELEDESDRS